MNQVEEDQERMVCIDAKGERFWGEAWVVSSVHFFRKTKKDKFQTLPIEYEIRRL